MLIMIKILASSYILVMVTLAQAQGPLQTTTPKHDLGTIRSGPPQVHSFDLKHTGTIGLVRLLAATSTCGCGAGELEKKQLEPGESTTLTYRVNTLTQPEGPLLWKLRVEYQVNDGPKQTLEMELKAKLERCITISPPVLAISTTKAITQEFVVQDRRATPFKITKTSTSNPVIALATQPQAEGKTLIRVSIPDDFPVGTQVDHLTLLTDDPTCPELKVPITIQKRQTTPFTATPAMLTIRLAKDQAELSAATVLRYRGQLLKVSKATCAHPGVTVRFAEGKAPLAAVRVIVKPADAGAAGSTMVTIELAEPAGETLQIPVSWYLPD